MMPRVVRPSDGTQSMAGTHHFRGCGTVHFRLIDAIDNMCTLCLQIVEMCFQGLRHLSCSRDKQSAVACARRRHQFPISARRSHQDALTDIIAVIAQAVNLEDAPDKLRCLFIHFVDIKRHEESCSSLGMALRPHVAQRHQDEEIVVGFPHLQKTLAALDILHQFGCITPNTVVWTHIDAGIEAPSRPCSLFRTIASAMEEHMVDATGEHQVEVGFHLRQRSAEMLGEPGESLAAYQRFSSYMSSRRSVFEHRHITEIGTGEA